MLGPIITDDLIRVTLDERYRQAERRRLVGLVSREQKGDKLRRRRLSLRLAVRPGAYLRPGHHPAMDANARPARSRTQQSASAKAPSR
jgi:hypothetical protein